MSLEASSRRNPHRALTFGYPECHSTAVISPVPLQAPAGQCEDRQPHLRQVLTRGMPSDSQGHGPRPASKATRNRGQAWPGRASAPSPQWALYGEAPAFQPCSSRDEDVGCSLLTAQCPAPLAPQGEVKFLLLALAGTWERQEYVWLCPLADSGSCVCHQVM